VPGNHLLYATRQAFDEIASPPGRVHVIDYVGTVLFDLRFQDVFQRGARTQAVLARPSLLNFSVVAICEERPLVPSIDRQEDMGRPFAKIQEGPDSIGKSRLAFGQLTKLRAEREIIPGILKEPHRLSPIIAHWHGESRSALFDCQISAAEQQIVPITPRRPRSSMLAPLYKIRYWRTTRLLLQPPIFISASIGLTRRMG
jgi:hypothetical protein